MTLGPLGPPPGAPPAAGYCARCGRRIGSYLAYAAGQAPEPGAPPGERICYRCHRLATRGRLPPSLPDAHGTGRAGVSQFVLYRLGMIFLALCTLFVLRRTGEGAPFFYGLGGIILLYTLSRRVRPRRRRPRATEVPDAAWEAAFKAPPPSDAPAPGEPSDRAQGAGTGGAGRVDAPHDH